MMHFEDYGKFSNAIGESVPYLDFLKKLLPLFLI